jgi:diphthamide biosynthesis methyltransferase
MLPSATSSPLVHSLSVLTFLFVVSGLRAYRAGMIVKLTGKTQELNPTLLKIIKKDNSIKWLSEQLESKPFASLLISPLF